jgi:L-iditol 2-dehydrogenase
MERMQALVVHGREDLRLEEVEVPTLSENEVLVQVKACGICGSDLPRALNGKVHAFPIVLGHEFSGVVENVDTSTTRFKKGDRVAVAPLLPCGACDYCKLGEPAMCESYSFLGSRKNGAMAEYVAVPVENLVPIPNEVDFRSAAMVEPLTVALHGIERVTVNAGATAIVFGAGTIGLLTLQCLKARGIGKVYVVDIIDEKLNIAKSLGADYTINTSETDIIDYFTNYKKPDVAFETAGTPITQKQCIDVVKKLGKVVFIGTATKDLTLSKESFEKILRGELELTGSWMSYSAPFPGYEWQTALSYIKDKKVDVDTLMTHLLKLDAGIEGFHAMRDKSVNSIKVMFEI